VLHNTENTETFTGCIKQINERLVGKEATKFHGLRDRSASKL
jgi:hypothetical protein